MEIVLKIAKIGSWTVSGDTTEMKWIMNSALIFAPLEATFFGVYKRLVIAFVETMLRQETLVLTLNVTGPVMAIHHKNVERHGEWMSMLFHLNYFYKVGCVFPVIVGFLRLHAEFGRNDQWEDALHFIK